MPGKKNRNWGFGRGSDNFDSRGQHGGEEEYDDEYEEYDDDALEPYYDEETSLDYSDSDGDYYPTEYVLRRNEELMSGEEIEEDEFEAYDMERRDYHPIRFRRDRRIGCLGGFMYAVFVVSMSLILACMAWMAASDVLALNKDSITTTIDLPKSIFEPKEIEVKDEDGNVTGTEQVQSADIDYVATVLKDNGLIEYKFLFKLFAKISNADIKVDPGSYELSTDFDYRALIKKMQTGSESQLRTTVMFPEGYTMHQIFKKLEENDICSYDDLMDAAANYDFAYSFLEDVPTGDARRLEGYLFPDTYEFYQGMRASSAINKLLEVFHYKITADMLTQAEELNITLYDALIIASMIEKEASGAEGERELIASVIYNRIKAGMPLQIDATSLYPYPEHEGAPTQAMLDDTSDPYNTRINTGLPPTPISNPGSASLQAALKPADTQYYYYLLDEATNEHVFFTNYNDFESFKATQSY